MAENIEFTATLTDDDLVHSLKTINSQCNRLIFKSGFRADGWPLCPNCGEDELYSLLNWNGEGDRPAIESYIDAGMRCYRCSWVLAKLDGNLHAS